MIVFGFASGLLLALLITPLIRAYARKRGILDSPTIERKKQLAPVPLLGGIAILLAFAGGVVFMSDSLLGGFLLPKHLAGILFGGAILAVGGALDDKFSLKPAAQLVAPCMAALVVIASGIGIDSVTNPFGGVIRLDLWNIVVARFGGVPYHLSLPGDAIVFVWLMVMMYTTKLLDGLDGLVSGLSVIGFIVIAILSLRPEFGQPELARFSMIAAGAFTGFLFYNARPASIYLGEGGSTLAGFLLGTAAIMSGAKIGTALLVMAVPFLDLIWVVIRRVILERKSFASSGRDHLHFQLIDLGLTPGQTVSIFWLYAAAFGAIALFVPHGWKAPAFLIIAAVFLLCSYLLWKRSKTRN